MFIEIKKKVEVKRGLKFLDKTTKNILMLVQCSLDYYVLVVVEADDKLSLGNREFDYHSLPVVADKIQKLLDSGEIALIE